MKAWLKSLLLLGLLIAAVFLIRQLPVIDDLRSWLKSFQDEGASSLWRFGAVGVLLALCFVPVTLMVGSAGFVFGWFWGFVVASGILLCGLGGGFWIGRWLWPKISQWKIFRQRIFQALRRAVEAEGHLLPCLLRMTPFLHFMTGNLFFGSLRLRFWPYLGFSYLGTVPGTLLMVAAGDLAASSFSGEQVLEIWHLGFFGLGLLLMAGLTWRMTRITRRILRQADADWES